MRLTKQQHIEIQELWITGNFKKAHLARQFSVSHQAITKIINKIGVIKEGHKSIKLHRINDEVDLTDEQVVDHIDEVSGMASQDRLSNLRITTTRNNCANRHDITSSKYTGVTWRKREQKWEATYTRNDVNWHVGYFDDELEAAKAYVTTLESCGVNVDIAKAKLPAEPIEPIEEEKPVSNPKLKFALIGSRSLAKPENAKDAKMFYQVAYTCAKLGISMRSGGTVGADSIAEQAYLDFLSENDSDVTLEIFVVTPTNKKFHMLPDPSNYNSCVTAVKHIHPNPDALTPYVMSLHCRNVNQLCGDNLKENVDAVICWTPEGKTSGGTATAINLANILEIPVFNLGSDTQNVLVQISKLIEGASSC